MSVNTGDDELLLSTPESAPRSRKWRCCANKPRDTSEKDGSDVPVTDEDDDDDLLSGEASCHPWKRLKKIQWFWAEPVLFLYMFCEFPTSLVNQKYILEWITMYNWNQDLLNNKTHDFNISNGDSVSICNINTSSPEYAFNQRNQMMSSYYGMLRMGAWVFPAIFSTLVLGSVSDQYGRKWAFLPPVVGNFVAIFALIFLIQFKGSILYLLILDFASGLSGSFGSIILAGVAHVVGKTTAKSRLFRLTVLQMFLLGGTTVSPFAMGQSYNHLGPILTLVITAAVSGLNLLYCLLCLPAMKDPDNSGLVVNIDQYSECKSHSVDNHVNLNPNEEGLVEISEESANRRGATSVQRRAQSDQTLRNGINDSQGVSSNSESSASSVSNVRNLLRQISDHVRGTFALYTVNGYNHRRNNAVVDSQVMSSHSTSSEAALSQSTELYSETNKIADETVCRLRILICAFFVVIIAYFDTVILTLFELNSPLCWDPATIGLYTGVYISVAAVGSTLFAPLMERFSSHITVAVICCLTSVAHRVYLFFVWDTKTMFAGVVLNLFSMMLIPSVRTMMTLLVEPGKHGAVLGSVAAVEILCCFLGSVIFSIVYSATLFVSTALVFLVSASLYAVGAIIFMAYRIKYGSGSIVITGLIQEILA